MRHFTPDQIRFVLVVLGLLLAVALWRAVHML